MVGEQRQRSYFEVHVIMCLPAQSVSKLCGATNQLLSRRRPGTFVFVPQSIEKSSKRFPFARYLIVIVVYSRRFLAASCIQYCKSFLLYARGRIQYSVSRQLVMGATGVSVRFGLFFNERNLFGGPTAGAQTTVVVLDT